MILVIGGLASGKRTYAAALGYAAEDAAFDVHELVRAGCSVDELVGSLSAKAVVTCAEVGGGVVPLDASERAWRDQVGLLSRELASRAELVVRMVCGIPVVLKDTRCGEGVPSRRTPSGTVTMDVDPADTACGRGEGGSGAGREEALRDLARMPQGE